MKYLTVLLAIFSHSFALAASSPWCLLWSDEFSKQGIIDPKKWSHELGYLRNEEYQIYSSSLNNVSIKNDKLMLTARDDHILNFEKIDKAKNFSLKDINNRRYTSGSITTKNKFSFKYGKLVVRAKLPQGKGLWPAIWLVGAEETNLAWPSKGEIDLLEYVGRTPNVLYSNIHFLDENGITSNTGSVAFSYEKPFEHFHDYTLIWNSNKIEFFIDADLMQSVDLSDVNTYNNSFDKPFYINLNLAVGGTFGQTVESNIFPAHFLIESVRVFERCN